MNRRRFLAGCTVSLATFVAGCPSDSGAEGRSQTSPTAPTEGSGTPNAEPTPAVTATGESPTPTATATATATPTDTPGPTPSLEKRQAALDAYRAGFVDRESYDRATREARIGYNRAKYGGAEIRYRDALESAEASVVHFERAGEFARQAGMSEAAGIARETRQYTERYLIPFAQRGIDAASAAKEERLDEASDLIAEMDALVSEARISSLDPASPAAFESALEL